jgi:hypothetical protein
MHLLRFCALLLALAGAAARCDEAKPANADKPKAVFANLGDTHAEVTVLQVLHALKATPAQRALLQKAAARTMQKPPPRKQVKVTESYRKALLGLRAALVSGDDEKIDEATETLDDLGDEVAPEFEDAEITDEARKQAPGLLKAFTARQVAAYVGGLDDFPDPGELLRSALEQSRKKKAKEWATFRDDVAYQVGWLAAGLDAAAEEKARDRATALLNKAARLSEKDFAGQRAQLEKEAGEVVGKLGPTDVIRHFMERLLAETLSNHRLTAALAASNKAAKD